MTFLVLDTVDKNLLLSLLEATVTTEPVFTSHYYDSLEANIEEKSFDGVMNGVSYVVAVDAPASTIKRITKEITVYNSDSIDHTFILSLNNTGDKRIISTFTLLAGRSASLSTEGYRGERGYQGFQGGVGSQGNQGAQGIQGSQGYQGYQGFQGNQGTQGNQGDDGQGADKLTINPQTGTTYTVVTADAGLMLRMNNANAITLTIDTNANQPLDTGTVITIEQQGAGVVTVTPASGVTINSTSRKTWGQYTVIQVYKVDTDVWNVIGGVA